MTGKYLVDFYALLGIDRIASSKEIEEACFRLGESLRPDTDSGKNPFAARKFALVEEAYVTLTNAETRETYDRKLDDQIRSGIASTSELAQVPHKREGILVMALSVAGAAITTAAAAVVVGPTAIGISSIIQIATFRLLSYQSFSGYTTNYLIEVDATVVLLLCFLLGLYGLLVFLAVLPQPSILWRRLVQVVRAN